MQAIFRKKRPIYTFILFYVITLVLYFPTRYAGFVFDFLGFEAGYKARGFLHYYSGSTMPNFRYVQHLFSYILCKTVGPDTIYWYILYCLFHALAAYFGYLVVKRLFNLYHVSNATIIALASTLLFIISPYQAEVVVWRVCIQYCFVSIAISLNILLLLSFFNEQLKWKPILAFIIFAINMFAIEQAACIPIVLFTIAVIINWTDNKQLIKKTITHFVTPQLLFIGFYFLLSKIVYHKWIMHYGSDAVNHAVSLETYTKFFRYIFRYVFLLRFIEDEGLKERIFSTISHPMAILSFSILTLFLFYKLIKNWLQNKDRSGLYLILILLYVITMLPVIQLYDTTLLLCTNDRLGYISSLFIFSTLSLFLLSRKKKFFAFIFFIIFLANSFFAMKMVHYWNISNKMLFSYARNFNHYDKKEIIALAVPDNYKGIWMVRDSSALKETINFRLKKSLEARIDEIANFNLTAYDNGVNVKKENDSTIYVTFKQYGNWWWYNGVGMTNREDEKFKITVDEWCGYHLVIKNIQQHNYTIIYPDNLQWKEFTF